MCLTGGLGLGHGNVRALGGAPSPVCRIQEESALPGEWQLSGMTVSASLGQPQSWTLVGYKGLEFLPFPPVSSPCSGIGPCPSQGAAAAAIHSQREQQCCLSAFKQFKGQEVGLGGGGKRQEVGTTWLRRPFLWCLSSPSISHPA